MLRHAAIATLLLPVTLLAQEPVAKYRFNPRLGEEATTAVDARGRRIRAGIARLGEEPGWAGRYYRGDGLGVNVVVELAPAAGYAFRWSGCLGVYDQDHGTCSERDGRITLVSAFPDAPERSSLLASELVPVRWGPRRYLIPSDGLIGFVNAIHGGREPRDGPHGGFLLRLGDERREVEDRPELPEAARAMLLDEPVTGTITAVHESRIEASGTLRYRVTDATIDRGAEHGLREGHVVRFRERGFGAGGGRVVEVQERTARIRIRDLLLGPDSERATEPAVGLEWTTHGRREG